MAQKFVELNENSFVSFSSSEDDGSSKLIIRRTPSSGDSEASNDTFTTDRKRKLWASLIGDLKTFSEKIVVIPEPIEQWSSHNDANLLQRVYNNPRKWSFVFQTLVMSDMLQTHIRSGSTKVIERSLGSTYHVFLRQHHTNKTMSHDGIKILQQWFHTAVDLFPTYPEVIIYLKSSPKFVLERIRKRDRKEERGIDIDYLAQIQTYYDEWLIRKNKTSRVLVINGEQTMEQILDDINTQLGDFE